MHLLWKKRKSREGLPTENVATSPTEEAFEEKPPQTSSITEEKQKDVRPEVDMIVCDFCGLNPKKEKWVKNKAVKKKTGLDIVQESEKENE